MKHIVSFSGGKDSTAMLLMMLEKGYPIDYIIFVDTTKEFPEIYQHIQKVEEYIYPLQITKLHFDYDYYFAEPELWEEIKQKEKIVNQRFRLDYTAEELERRFTNKSAFTKSDTIHRR